MRSRTSGVLIAAALVSTACDDDEEEFAGPEPSLEDLVARVRSDLEEHGYEVLQGDRKLFPISECAYVVEKLGNCLGNNPATPYVLPTVPLWPDEYVDEAMRDVTGPTPGDTWTTHRMDEREALVVIAHLPPPGAYFGIQSYAWSREGRIDTSDEIYQSLDDDLFIRSIAFMTTPNPDRVLTFSSVGESTNDVVIERQSGAAFGRDRSFVITPDAVMERAVTAALLRAGVADRDRIFTEPVSDELVRLGLGEHADDFVTLLRYTLPDDEAAGDAWRRELPLYVLRVRDPHASRATEPYPAPVRDVRIARPELALGDDVDDLADAVRQRWGQPDAHTSEFESLLLKLDLVGSHCLARPMNCLGDTSDADYQISETVGIDDGQVLAVLGTLGTETGNATYTSLSVNWIPPLVGVSNVNNEDLVGTASPFSPTVDHAGELYVQYFARDCTGLDGCFTITDEMVPPGGEVKIIQRNYVVPGDLRGPNPFLVIDPQLVVLDGAHRPG